MLGLNGQRFVPSKEQTYSCFASGIGVKVNTSPNPDHSGFDFLFLEDESLIDFFPISVFIEDTLPDLASTPTTFEVHKPKGGVLKLKTAATNEIKANVPVKVDQSVFSNTNQRGHFDLGLSGQSTSPGFSAQITLKQ